MRIAGFLVAGLIGLAVASCGKPKADEDELADFDPPTVQDRVDVVPRQQARFDRLDKNKDGFLTTDEFPPRRAARLAAFDTDQDGKLSRSELVEGAIKRFDRLDANKDGRVTPEERRAAGE